MHIRKSLIAAAATAALAGGTLAAFAGLTSASAAEAGTTASAGNVKIAYYDQWSVYGNAFYPK
ncbi:glycoside hydrolase, partial [Streptomyces sp. NPDC059956]